MQIKCFVKNFHFLHALDFNSHTLLFHSLQPNEYIICIYMHVIIINDWMKVKWLKKIESQIYFNSICLKGEKYSKEEEEVTNRNLCTLLLCYTLVTMHMWRLQSHHSFWLHLGGCQTWGLRKKQNKLWLTSSIRLIENYREKLAHFNWFMYSCRQWRNRNTANDDCYYWWYLSYLSTCYSD